MAKFGQYCDEIQMARLIPLPEDEDDDDNSEENLENVNEFDDEDLLPEELEMRQMFFNQFGLASFGQVICQNILNPLGF